MKFVHRFSKKVAQTPGTLVHVGEARDHRVQMEFVKYNRNAIQETMLDDIDAQSVSAFEGDDVHWININGVHDIQLVQTVGTAFGIHSLALEDIVNTNQRPKMEDFDDHLFVVLKMLRFDEASSEVKAEQVSFILGHRYVISFQEWEGDVFDPVRERLRHGRGRVRRMGADYLFYALLDAVVDHYFFVLESVGERIEGLEADLLSHPEPLTLNAVHSLKQEMIFLRKSISPLREVTRVLAHGESPFIRDETSLFLRDVYDHTIMVIETSESLRDLVAGLQDLYLSSVSNKMNEVMKVLTIIATIFIPLTFIAGIYGMNFNPEVSPFNMPELNARFGYIIVWLAMLLVGGFMVAYFRRKKWL